MRRALLIAVSIVICGAMVLVLRAGFGHDPRAVPDMMTGTRAPTFASTDLRTGEKVDFASYRGKPVVLNFWSTYCQACEEELPILEWARKAYGERAEFVAVLNEDERANAVAFVERTGTTWRQLHEPQSTVSVAFGVTGVPETFFIAPDGTIKSRALGPFRTREQFVSRIEELLK